MQRRWRAVWLAASLPGLFMAVPLPAAVAAEPGTPKTIAATEARPQLELQLGHRGAILTLAYAPDGQLVASAGDDGMIKLWDTSTGELRATLPANQGPLLELFFMPDGKTLASAGGGPMGPGQVMLWNTVTAEGTEVPIKEAYDQNVAAVAFSPDGRTVACGLGDEYGGRSGLRIFDLPTGKLIRSQPLAGFGLAAVAYSPDGQTIAVAGQVKKPNDHGRPAEVRLLNARTGQWLRSLRKPGKVYDDDSPSVSTVAFSPDGKVVAAPLIASSEMWAASEVVVWETATGKLRCAMQQVGAVVSLNFTSDSRTLISSGGIYTLGEVKFWDLATGRAKRTLSGNTDYIFPVALSPDGETVAIAALADTVDRDILAEMMKGDRPDDFKLRPPGGQAGPASLTFWNLHEKKAIATPTGHSEPFSGAQTCGTARLLTAGAGGIRIWDTTTGRLQLATTGMAPIAASPDGTAIATASAAEWPVPVQPSRVAPPGTKAGAKGTGAKGSGPARRNPMPPRTESVAVVRLRSAKDGKLLRTLRAGGPNDSDRVAFSPDGKLLAVGEFGGDSAGVAPDRPWSLLTIWDVATGRQLRRIRTLGGYGGNPVAFSPDGKSIATGGQTRVPFMKTSDTVEAGAVQIWDVATGKLRRTLTVPDTYSALDTINGVAFSPDGAVLAGRGHAGTVLWDAKTGRLLRVLEEWANLGNTERNEHGTRPLAFSPDGTLLATETSELCVSLWRVKDGKLMGTLEGHDDGILALTFLSPDTLASASIDGTLRYWNVHTGALRATAMILTADQNGGTTASPAWIVFTPAGYYDASPGAARLIRWRTGSKLFPASAMEEMHRPELVREALAVK